MRIFNSFSSLSCLSASVQLKRRKLDRYVFFILAMREILLLRCCSFIAQGASGVLSILYFFDVYYQVPDVSPR